MSEHRKKLEKELADAQWLVDFHKRHVTGYKRVIASLRADIAKLDENREQMFAEPERVGDSE